METFDAHPRGWDEGPGLLQSAWRYKWVIAVAALLGVLLAYGWAARQPVLYQGTSRLLFSGSGSAILPGQAVQPPADPERYLRNQAQLIGSVPVLERAAKHSGVQGASADTLAAQMTVEVEQDADVITISVLDAAPRSAASLANEIGAAYQGYMADQSKGAAERFRAVNSRLQARLNEINTALAATPPPPEADVLQLERDAIGKQQKENAGQLAAIIGVGGGNPVQLQEKAAVPGQPSQPATRRTMAVGVLLGLVGGVALAWLLNTRRTSLAASASSAPSSAFQSGGAGSGLAPDAAGEAWPVEPEPLAETSGGRPDADPAGDGGAIPRLARRPARERNIDLDQARGTGQGGRVRPSDVEAFRQQGQGAFPAGVDQGATGEPVEDNEEGLGGLFVRLDTTLADQPLDFYSQATPQTLAEEVASDVSADFVAVLLDNGAGSFEVAGGVGLTADEHGAVVDQDHDVLRQAVEDGVGVFDNAERLRTVAAGIPGSQTAEALIVVPLVRDPSWLGALLVGRRSGNGRRATAFSDQEIQSVVQCAMTFAFILQSLLLLRQLQQCLRALDPGYEQRAERAAGSG